MIVNNSLHGPFIRTIKELSSLEDYMKKEPLSKVGPDPFMMKDSKLLEKEFKNKSILSVE